MLIKYICEHDIADKKKTIQVSQCGNGKLSIWITDQGPAEARALHEVWATEKLEALASKQAFNSQQIELNIAQQLLEQPQKKRVFPEKCDKLILQLCKLLLKRRGCSYEVVFSLWCYDPFLC